MVTQEMYEMLSTKYTEEIKILELESEKMEHISSNLEKSVSKGLYLAQNISKIWSSSDFDNKQKLQYLVCPTGYCITKKRTQFEPQK